MKINKVSALFLLLFSVSSCQYVKYQIQAKKMIDSQIVIPTGLSPTSNRPDYEVSQCFDDTIYKMVVYFSKKECTICKIQDMLQWREIVSFFQRQNNADIFFVFDVSKLAPDMAALALKRTTFDLPVWFDTRGDFQKLNPQIPPDTRLHVFLMDGSNKIILTGNPLFDGDLWKLYQSKMNTGI